MFLHDLFVVFCELKILFISNELTFGNFYILVYVLLQVVDSMVVERARGESQSMSGSLQSLCWGSSSFGGIVSSYFSGALVDSYGVRCVHVYECKWFFSFVS